jgi:hypothetical protein
MTVLRLSPTGAPFDVTSPDEALAIAEQAVVAGYPDQLWINVAPTYAGSSQAVKQNQPAKPVSSIVDVAIATTGRDVSQRGSLFSLTAGTVGPIRWLGTGGAAGYSLINVLFTAAYLNNGIDVATEFYFGVRTGGSAPNLANVRYLRAADPARNSVTIFGQLLVQNGDQPASELWPVISGAGSWLANTLQWTEQQLLVWDSKVRI